MRLITIVVALSVAVAAIGAQRELVEGIVVRVNERILTTHDLQERVREKEAETASRMAPEAYPGVVWEAADELVLLERAAELKIEVDDKEVDAALRQLMANNQVSDEATFARMLSGAGLSIEKLRTRLRETLIINRVLSREIGTFEITEEELRRRYARDQERYMQPERLHLEHVVWEVGADPVQQAEALEDARRLVAAARSGTPFLTLVEAEQASGAASGGDLGTISREDLRSEIRDAAEGLSAGAVSEPFTTALGVHVVRLVERSAAAPRPFDEIKAELREAETAERYRSRLSGVVDNLKVRYVVEVHPEYFVPPAAP